jgi:hypothetical protein
VAPAAQAAVPGGSFQQANLFCKFIAEDGEESLKNYRRVHEI